MGVLILVPNNKQFLASQRVCFVCIVTDSSTPTTVVSNKVSP